MKQTDIFEFAKSLGIHLDEAQIDRLAAFEELLASRAIPAGLIATTDSGRLRRRHILDSLRAAAVSVTGAEPRGGTADGPGRFVDLGSGAGLPGLVLAIALPDARITMIERRPKRAAFLELAVGELGLTNAGIFAGAVAEFHPGRAVDVCFARAFAPLGEAWKAASGFLGPAGRLVYFQGAGTEPGLAQASLPEKSAKIRLEPCPLLESSGPLVIMTRK